MLARTNNPFGSLFRLHDELNRAFEDRNGFGLDPTRASAWAPAVNVFEDAETLTFKLDLPEVKKEDVHVRVDKGVLTIEGSRSLEREDKKTGYHRIERSFGKFARAFSLPDTVSSENVNAELKDGVLRIVLGKRKEAQPKHIEVKVS